MMGVYICDYLRLCTHCVRASTESNDRGNNSIFVKRLETFVLSVIYKLNIIIIITLIQKIVTLFDIFICRTKYLLYNTSLKKGFNKAKRNRHK